eukprot:CAMPEP_0116837270 /NCGR_PEP_ID=MMETSP0418-20121206/8559_1 /TAXON_ID=1158023 /ORGANISM="Astrosyne radiata, Strain 13vi08-1A" /LENGTH=98 /DNA_ID=CAMNT_0004467133 /DNA_START=1686 /DNA_END=1979 /DNA_ORIENTATION=+
MRVERRRQGLRYLLGWCSLYLRHMLAVGCSQLSSRLMYDLRALGSAGLGIQWGGRALRSMRRGGCRSGEQQARRYKSVAEGLSLLHSLVERSKHGHAS